MRLLLSLIFLAIAVINATAQTLNTPLSAYSAEWNDPKYKACNTAENTKYMTEEEKQIVYILNLARMNPQLFCKTVLPKANIITWSVDTSSDIYYKSLVTEMQAMEPLGILQPDSLCYVSASCHAVSSGKVGYDGHVRQTGKCNKLKYFMGECCQYGIKTPLGIVVALMVDQNVPSLGHRQICLGRYTKMSPSIAPHKTFGTVAVLDFY